MNTESNCILFKLEYGIMTIAHVNLNHFDKKYHFTWLILTLIQMDYLIDKNNQIIIRLNHVIKKRNLLKKSKNKTFLRN